MTQLNLVNLQNRLNALEIGAELTIGIADYRRLFGPEAAGHGDLENFATGHGCRVDPRISAVVFRKVRRAAA